MQMVFESGEQRNQPWVQQWDSACAPWPVLGLFVPELSRKSVWPRLGVNLVPWQGGSRVCPSLLLG